MYSLLPLCVFSVKLLFILDVILNFSVVPNLISMFIICSERDQRGIGFE